MELFVEGTGFHGFEAVDEFPDFILAETVPFFVGFIEHFFERPGGFFVVVAYFEEFDGGAEVPVEEAGHLGGLGLLFFEESAEEEERHAENGEEGESEQDEDGDDVSGHGGSFRCLNGDGFLRLTVRLQ